MVNKMLLCSICVIALFIIEMIIFISSNILYEVTAPKPGLQHQWISILWFNNDARGLGNELFCFASLLGISFRLNMSTVISKEMKINHVFKLNISAVERQTNFLVPYSAVKERKYHDCKYDEEMVRDIVQIRSNIALNGYFQSWKYFQNVTDLLRKNLVFQDQITEGVMQFFRKRIPNFNSSNPQHLIVGIHVRRGDMLTNKQFNSYGYTFPSADYFRNAINYFTEKYPKRLLYFVVVSNDMAWAKSNLQQLHPNLIFSSTGSYQVDFAIISMCDHTIMSTGSFGWWGAWLANGTTIYYKNWPRQNSRLARMVRKEDYFPPHWIPMT